MSPILLSASALVASTRTLSRTLQTSKLAVSAELAFALERTGWRTAQELLRIRQSQVPPGEVVDVGVPKGAAEWLLWGCASVPEARAFIDCEVIVGARAKTLRVWGARHWEGGPLGWRPSEPEPHSNAALGWAGAYGGAHWAPNPLGTGRHAHRQLRTHGQVALPAIERVHAPARQPDQAGEAVGFGARAFLPAPARAAHELPVSHLDMAPNGTACQLADPDQWVGAWRGDEPFGLHGFHAAYAHVTGTLPGVRARCFARFATGTVLEIPCVTDTVCFFPSALSATLLFRARLDTGVDPRRAPDTLMVAVEPLDASRSEADYAAVMHEALALSGAARQALLDAQLMPHGVPMAPLDEAAIITPPLAGPAAMAARAEQREWMRGRWGAGGARAAGAGAAGTAAVAATVAGAAAAAAATAATPATATHVDIAQPVAAARSAPPEAVAPGTGPDASAARAPGVVARDAPAPAVPPAPSAARAAINRALATHAPGQAPIMAALLEPGAQPVDSGTMHALLESIVNQQANLSDAQRARLQNAFSAYGPDAALLAGAPDATQLDGLHAQLARLNEALGSQLGDDPATALQLAGTTPAALFGSDPVAASLASAVSEVGSSSDDSATGPAALLGRASESMQQSAETAAASSAASSHADVARQLPWAQLSEADLAGLANHLVSGAPLPAAMSPALAQALARGQSLVPGGAPAADPLQSVMEQSAEALGELAPAFSTAAQGLRDDLADAARQASTEPLAARLGRLAGQVPQARPDAGEPAGAGQPDGSGDAAAPAGVAGAALIAARLARASVPLPGAAHAPDAAPVDAASAPDPVAPAPVAQAWREARLSAREPLVAPVAAAERVRRASQLRAAVREARPVHGVDFSWADLAGAQLRGANLAGALLEGADLTGACLDGAVLHDAALTHASLTETTLNGADLRGANLSGAQARHAKLDGAQLDGTRMEGTDLSHASLVSATLQGARAPRSIWRFTDASRSRAHGIDLEAADLRDARLADAQWPGARLLQSRLARMDGRRASLNSALLFRAQGEGCILDQADLAGANCQEASLPELSARHLRARGSRWTAAQLGHSRFMDADLTHANFHEAQLGDAHLVRCLLSHAILSQTRAVRLCCDHSQLFGAGLNGMDAREASFRHANLERTGMENIRLDNADLTAANLLHTLMTAGARA